jgi:hypothetical protein
MDKFVTVRHLRRYETEFDGTPVVLPFGGVTILAIVDLTDPDARTIDFSLAFCSPKDLYCKETGRSTALSRMIAGDMYSMDYTDYETGGSIMDQVAEFVYDELPLIDPDTFRLFEKCQNTYG